MNVSRPSTKVLIGFLITLFFGIALFIRVYFPYDQVFSGDWIRYTGVDAYYHMRIVDNLVHNFPHLINFDPFRIYPGGSEIAAGRFLDRLLASVIWIVGLGSPSQHTVDVIGVYFPAVLAALIVIPVYFIGKELFNRWAGVLSAALIAILPGEFMGRSILGFTDHHVAETLFATTTMLFLILAIKSARQRQLTFSHFYRRDWAIINRPVIYSLLTGIFLGIYFLTWSGALLFAFTISVYFIIQFIIDHWRHQSTDYLCLVGAILFFVTLIIFLPSSTGMLYLVSLIVALLAPVLLNGISRRMTNKRIRYPLTLVGLGIVGLGIFYLIEPVFFLRTFHVFWPTEVSRTTLEMQPLLFPQGNFTLKLAWGNFTAGFFLSFGLLLYWIFYTRVFRKQGSAEDNILLIWSIVILLATLGQRRFAYYFAVNVALLTGYLLWLLLKLNEENHSKARYLNIVFSAIMIVFLVKLSNFNPLLVAFSVALLILYILWQLLPFVAAWFLETPKPKLHEKTRPKKVKRAGFRLTTRQLNMALAIIIGFFLVFFPNINPAITTARSAPFGPSDAWQSSLIWLKGNSPE
ncbi:STT3 domain-containing protein, partial [Chloroflexota bacterium]